MIKQRQKDIIIDLASYTVGGALLAVGTQVFYAPNNIAPGGIGGVAIMLNYLFGAPISASFFVMNIPLVILAWIYLGRGFTVKTLFSVAVVTVAVEAAGEFLPAFQGDKILASLYGGVLVGIGQGITFARGATSGGTDIIMRLVQIKRPDFSAGRLIMIISAILVMVAAIVYRSIDAALYAVIGIFASSRMVDSILNGMDMGKALMISTSKAEELTSAIHTSLKRGCTILDAKGAYTGQSRPVILCVVRKSQYYELKTLVNMIDHTAFIIAFDSSEVIGKGFKTLE